MRSARILVVLAAGVGAVSCSPPAAPPPVPSHPVASVAPPADASALRLARTDGLDAAIPIPAAPAPPPRAPLAAWTAPEAVALLADDCAAEPAPPADGEPNPLSCRLPFDQSCVYDPCFQRAQACRGDCSKTCGLCDSTCMQGCQSCSASCKDDVCKKACAERTGACKQACLQGLDHCATAGCAGAVRPCMKDELRKWAARGCSCKTMNPCVEPCLQGADVGPCLERCRKRYPGCDIGYCIMGGGAPTRPYD